MKHINKLIIILCLAGILAGCASTNPQAGQPILNPTNGLPTGQVQPPYIPNTTGTKIVAYTNEAAPLIPAPWGDLLALGGATATIIMGGLAKAQSSKATTASNQAASAQATTSQLAASVAAQGPTVAQAVIDHASNSGTAPLVFDAVNKALPADPIVISKT